MKTIDLLGQRIGRLVVIALARRQAIGPNRKMLTAWRARCDCGRVIVRLTSSLGRGGGGTSCGCLRAELTGARFLKHGMIRTPTYTSWRSMLRRCRTPTASNFARYGGRGVTVCARWERFENFFADMGERPIGRTIDRIDNSRGYEPGNCRWATPQEQARNRTKHKGEQA